jgi:apolipoprotein N-acyltransferase
MATATPVPQLHWEGQVFPPLERESRLATPGLRLCLCAAISGVLLWACYFPVAWGWLAWFALVPVLCLVRGRLSTKGAFGCALVGGLIFFVPALQWMRVADPMMYATWLALALYCTLFFAVGILLLRRLDRCTRLPLMLTLPVVWTALEYLRAHLLTGFPWYFLGHTQHNFLPLIQVADLAGAYAVTFVVAAVNAWLFEILTASWRLRKWLPLAPRARKTGRLAFLLELAAPPSLVAAVLGYGYWRMGQAEFAEGPRLALLQGNLDQGIRNAAFSAEDEVDKAQRTMVEHYWDLTEQGAKHQPDLIVWPETSWPGYWMESDSGQLDDDSQRLVKFFQDRWHSNVLLGLNAHVGSPPEKGPRYNSAVLLGKDGIAHGRYDKMHRVPFGEYVPFKEALPWMNVFAPYDFDYSIRSGDRFTRFPLGNLHFGVLICYEDTDPFLARQYVQPQKGEPEADFLVNVSNDGWFRGTSEHEEHLAICRFRAVECRRPVVRSVNMGISAVIDGNGRVLAPHTIPPIAGLSDVPIWVVDRIDPESPGLRPGQWSEFKKVAGVLVAPVPLDQRSSLYARWGDWLPQGCWAVVALGFVASLLPRK